jgi:ComF family protein
MKARSLIQLVLDLLYPTRCAGCKSVGCGEWCAECDGKIVLYSPGAGQKFLDLGDGPPMTVVSAAPFGPPVREAIHALKYTGGKNLDAPLAKHMSRAFAQSGVAVDIIIPIPIHKKRQRERGYNQSELLARQISTFIYAPMAAKAMTRVRHTSQQAKLSAAERKANVKDAFSGDPAVLKNKRVLLVDDVFTTGATLMEAGRAARAAGAAEVFALTLARAD